MELGAQGNDLLQAPVPVLGRTCSSTRYYVGATGPMAVQRRAAYWSAFRDGLRRA